MQDGRNAQARAGLAALPAALTQVDSTLIGLWWLWLLIIAGLGYALHRWTMEEVAGVTVIGLPVLWGAINLIGPFIERALK